MSATASPGTVTQALCEARGVGHVFLQPGGRDLRVLEGIDVEVRPGEIVALLGPSGCGKSTLMRILAGLIRATEGEVLARGAPLAGLHPDVAVVFQSAALYPWMTVAGNIRAVLEARGLPAEEIARRIAAAVTTVGLAGFEDSYPRQLSGGMKQRAGIARALSVEPALLLMDEPFSAVDALTAESLRAEVVDIWLSHRTPLSSILMVSHDIKEVVYMADRVVVLSANPGRIHTVLENRLPRPRDYRAPELLRLVDELHDIITGRELPDPSGPPPEFVPIEPLPDASASEIKGLLEYLDARGGREDLFRISAETHREFGRVITVVKAAELLELVDTPKRTVVLEAEGRRFVAAPPAERTVIWRERLLRLRLFRQLVSAMERAPERRIERDAVLEILAIAMPEEDLERVFGTLVRWAQAGDLFGYDEHSEELVLERTD
jgi:NitT/TauT family transport system ATP-binding protein